MEVWPATTGTMAHVTELFDSLITHRRPYPNPTLHAIRFRQNSEVVQTHLLRRATTTSRTDRTSRKKSGRTVNIRVKVI